MFNNIKLQAFTATGQNGQILIQAHTESLTESGCVDGSR